MLQLYPLLSHHDEPHDERRVFDVPDAAVVDVSLHLQVEEKTLVDDVGKPAGHNRRGKHTHTHTCTTLSQMNVYR